MRAVFVIALIGSAAITLYGMLIERGGLQIPIAVAGAGMLGLTLIALAMWGGRRARRLGQRGVLGRAFGSAVLGGLAAIGAAGALAGAIVLAFVSRAG